VLDVITSWLGAAFSWLLDVFLWVPLKVMQLLADGWIFVIAAIPPPDWFAQLDFSNIPPSVAYFAGPFHIGLGMSITGSAYITRFIIRRIPGIG
jgi:Protein of unknown function (DUF2523)